MTPINKPQGLMAAPNEFRGTIGEMVEDFVMPNLPPLSRLVECTEAFLRYALEDSDPIHIVRGPDKGHLQRIDGSLVVDSDNATPIWSFLRCLDRSTDPCEVLTFIRDASIPILMALSAKKRSYWDYGREMSQGEKDRLWTLNLKHCHILPLGAPGLSLRHRFLRNICPLNHFLFPSPKKFHMQRIDWSESNVPDLGESTTVIGLIQQRVLELLRKQGGAATYDRFLDLTGGTILAAPSPDLRIQLRRRDNSVSPSRTSGGPYQTNSVVSDSAAPNDSAQCHWTLNEEHGFYARTKVRDRVVHLFLCCQSLAGETTLVGEYVLDLPSLSELGVVSRRWVNDEFAYRVRIVRERDGSYWLRVKGGVSLALEKLRVAEH